MAMVHRVEGVRVHLEHPWVLRVPVSVRQARWGQGGYRQVLVHRPAILELRGRVQVLREPEIFPERVLKGWRGLMLVRREEWHLGWAANQAFEQALARRV